MKTLKAIQTELAHLWQHPDPDELTFEYVSDLVRMANRIAAKKGIDIQTAGEMMRACDGLIIVSGYIAAIPPQEWITVPEAAALLSVHQSKITTWIREGRLTATDVASNGKRPTYRINRAALSNIRPPAKPVKHRRAVNSAIDI